MWIKKGFPLSPILGPVFPQSRAIVWCSYMWGEGWDQAAVDVYKMAYVEPDAHTGKFVFRTPKFYATVFG